MNNIEDERSSAVQLPPAIQLRMLQETPTVEMPPMTFDDRTHAPDPVAISHGMQPLTLGE